jgi:excisionase family DNA binding protein
MDSPYLTTAQAAKVLGMTTASVSRLVTTGKLEIWRIDSARYLIVAASVQRYLQEHRRPEASRWSRAKRGR